MVRKVYLGENFELRKINKEERSGSVQSQTEANKEIFELQQLTKEQLKEIINHYPRNGVSERYKDNAIKVLNDLND